jgi:OHCU decarboxylase
MMLNPQPSQCDQQDFIAAYGQVYEHSPWVAAIAYGQGLTRDDDAAPGLAVRFAAIVDAADEARKLTLLRAHPELAGNLAMAGELTHSSAIEQSGAGLNQCTAEEFARFHVLNQLYRDRFGFPFIIAVSGLTRHDILAAFETRVKNDPSVEFATALVQVHRIARIRLDRMAQ